MNACPACGTPYKSPQSRFCTSCGAKRPFVEINTCTNPNCPNYDRQVDPDAQYCDLCGNFTAFGKLIDDIT